MTHLSAGVRIVADSIYSQNALDSLLRTNRGEPLADLKRLGERLQSGDVDEADLRQLEVLAQGLEQARVEVDRRMQGR